VVADHTAADFPSPGDNAHRVVLKGQRARYIRVTATRLWRRTGDYAFALAELQVESAGRNLALGAAVTALDSIEAGLWGKRHLVAGLDSRRKLPEAGDATFHERLALQEALRQKVRARQELVERLAGKETVARAARAEARLAELDGRLRALPAGPQV